MAINPLQPSNDAQSGAKSYTLSASDFALDEWPLDIEVLDAMSTRGARPGDKAEYTTTESILGGTISKIRYVFTLLADDTIYRAPMPKPEYTASLGLGDVREGVVWAQLIDGILVSFICEVIDGVLSIVQYAPLGDVVSVLPKYFGNAVAAPDNIANGTMIDPVSFRFLATQSSKIQEMYQWWRADNANGYSAGTGGSYRMEIQSDLNGSPSGVVLGNPAYYTPDLVAYPSGLVLAVDIDGPETKAGNVYHLVLTNLDANPDGNFISFNGIHFTADVFDDVSGRPEQPDMRTLYYHSLAGAPQAWIDYPEDSFPNVYYMPLLGIGYENGFYDGEDNQYGNFVTSQPIISGANKIRTIMTCTDSGPTNSLRFFGRKNLGSDPITISVNGVSQELQGVTSDLAWYSVPFTDGIVFGQEYLIELSCPATSEFEVFGTRRINPGWKPTRLYEAPAEFSIDDGVTWEDTNPVLDDDVNSFSLYFSTKN